MTILVTIGCSHSAGSMIDGRNGTSWYNKQHSFGGVIAKKYQMSHFSLGVPGGSNQYIYRSTIRFVNNFMNDSDDYIFLIGWTSTNRIEMRYPENSPYTHKVIGDFLDTKYVPFTVGTDPALYHTRELKQMDRLCPLIFYENQLESDWAVYAYTLQKLFANKKLKYYMFNTCHDLPVNKDNVDIVQALNTELYYKPTEFDDSMLYWALNKGFEKTTCWHLKADGHAAWAGHLEELLKEQGLLDNITPVTVTPSVDTININNKKINNNDLNAILKKYKIQARIILDSLYDKIYVLYPENDTEQVMKIKTNMINRDLVKRFGSNVKIDKFDNLFAEMDDTFVTEHFRKQNRT